MNEERLTAEQLEGYKFFRHPDTPTFGILRLDTENENHFVMVTRTSLRALGEACLKHADQLEDVQ